MAFNILVGYLIICVLIAVWCIGVIARDYYKKVPDDKCPPTMPFWKYFKFHGAFVIIPTATPVINLIFLYIVLDGALKRGIGSATSKVLLSRKFTNYTIGLLRDDVKIFPCKICDCKAITHTVQPAVMERVGTGEREFVQEHFVRCQNCGYEEYSTEESQQAAIQWNMGYLNTRRGLDWWRVYFGEAYDPRMWESDRRPTGVNISNIAQGAKRGTN